MRVVEYNYGKDPYIPTEETMFKKLRESSIGDEWVLHELPLAHMINSSGVKVTQDAIQKLDTSEKKIFVCQHILVDQLHVDENSIMCSPHASDSNDVISIPHYPVNTGNKTDNPGYLFSFIGSTSTHPTRRGLVKLFPENCFDSGVHWGLEKSLGEDFGKRYSDMLSNSLYAVCPRGTGISSVRLFEAMATGTVPIIIADGYRPPLDAIIDWDEISIRIPEKKIKKIEDILYNQTSQEIRVMIDKLEAVYQEYFSPENFHKSIEYTIQNLI